MTTKGTYTNWGLEPVSTDDVLGSYGEYLRMNHPANFDRFQRIRSASRESAFAEAVVFQMLDQLCVDPHINDTVQFGGADFICNGSYRSPVLRRLATPNPQDRFVVEATSLDLDAVANRSGIPNEVEDGQGRAFSLLTHSVRNKAADKATQLANYDMPRVLAIASSHAGIATLFNTFAAQWCLVSNPKIMTPIGGGPATQITDLGSSVFLKTGPAGTIEVCRQSISAILLVSVHADRSCVCGILHPDPARTLNIRFLPNVPFIRITKWPIVDGSIETEWVIGEPEERLFRHQRVTLPELEPQGIVLSVDPPAVQAGD
jgi:hypothetical protein